MTINSIDDVLEELTKIIDNSKRHGKKEGFFAALYFQVTDQIRLGIKQGLFSDGPRMERLDVIFANRYLEALSAWQTGGSTSRSWRLAAENLKNGELIILQHLLLAMNAHINLDLGIAAAEVAPGSQINGLEQDFQRINTILGTLIDPVETTVGNFSPLLSILDRVGGKSEELLIGFSMRVARNEAWEQAQLLAHLSGWSLKLAIKVHDRKTALLGKLIVNPPALLRKGLHVIRESESKDVAAIIEALASVQPKTNT